MSLIDKAKSMFQKKQAQEPAPKEIKEAPALTKSQLEEALSAELFNSFIYNEKEDETDEASSKEAELTDEDLAKLNEKIEHFSEEDILSAEQEALRDQAADAVGVMSDSEMDEEIRKLLSMETADEPEAYVDTLIEDVFRSAPTEEQIEEAMSIPKKAKRNMLGETVNVFNKKTLFIGMAVFIVLVIGSGVFLFISVNNLNKLAAKPRLSDAQEISANTFVANNANYIFLNMTKSTDYATLKLTKMVSDSLATVFYFDSWFDVTLYELLLTDETGKFYAFDPGFENDESGDATKKVLRFDPLAEGSKVMTLRLNERATGQSMEFNLILEEGLVYPPAKYLTERLELYSEEDFSIFIESAKFSSSGTWLDYSFEWKGKITKLAMGGSKIDVKLSDAFGSVLPQLEAPKEYRFSNDKLVLGHMDFSAVSNLGGRVRFTFNDLHKYYLLNKRVTVSELFGADSQALQKTIDLGGYKLVLERFGKQSSKYILVLHTVDENYAGEVTELGKENRIENIVECSLIIEHKNGELTKIEGVANSKRIGSDIVFEAQEDIAKNGQEGFNSMRLLIYDSVISIPEKSVTVDLSELFGHDSEADTITKSSLLAAFDSSRSAQAADYSSKLISAASIGNDIYAVIAEESRGGSLHQLHKIKASADTNGKITILKDEFIN